MASSEQEPHPWSGGSLQVDEAEKKATEKAKAIEQHKELVRRIHDAFAYYDRGTPRLGPNFGDLISPPLAKDRDGSFIRRTVELLAGQLDKINVFYKLVIDPLQVIRRVWGPFDYAGDEIIEDIRSILFGFAERCRRHICGSRITAPHESRAETIESFAIIFVPLDRAAACLQTPAARLRILERLCEIECSVDCGWTIPLSRAVVQVFAELDDLIDELGVAQMAIERKE